MIGVIPGTGQAAAVREFFELFKTPWEFYRDGRAYDAVIATAGEVPAVRAGLLVVSGSRATDWDGRMGIGISSRRRGAVLEDEGERFPLFGDVAAFAPGRGEARMFAEGRLVVGLRLETEGMTVLRLGYDLFEEAAFLMGPGQPAAWAPVPTLERHIGRLRDWLLQAGLPFLEIPPVPGGHPFAVCLSHDIDFAGIRFHKFDHTMWGFLARATVGSLERFVKGRMPLGRLLRNWLAAASLPLVYVGLLKDFWLPFEWYLRLEAGLAATYFLIPFKKRPGENVPDAHPERRAAAYDIADIPEWTAALVESGCEIGVHGLDAWRDAGLGRQELARIASVTGAAGVGVRMHWLLWDRASAAVLEQAGFVYDSSSGFNEAVGYRCGTTQVFLPPGASGLLELPVNVQDGALFFPKRLDLTEDKAWEVCLGLLDNAAAYGGAFTVIWHDRSPRPERQWGDFYVRLVGELKSRGAWFGTASQVVGWFRDRRSVAFEALPGDGPAAGIRLSRGGKPVEPPFEVRVYRGRETAGGGSAADVEKRRPVIVRWSGETDLECDLAPRRGAE